MPDDSVTPPPVNVEADRRERVRARIADVLKRDCVPVFHGQTYWEISNNILLAMELEYAR